LICPKCRTHKPRTLTTRPCVDPRQVRRRRECRVCSFRWSTREVPTAWLRRKTPSPVDPIQAIRAISMARTTDGEASRLSDAAEDTAAVVNTRAKVATVILCGREPLPECPGVYYLLRGRAVKIGCAKALQRRLVNLQVGHPDPLRVAGYIAMRDFAEARALEGQLHKCFKDEREHGEWFRFTDAIRVHLRSLATDWNDHA
jgi:hypothetical protein